MAESLYRDIIFIVSHVSWIYRIVRYPAIPTPNIQIYFQINSNVFWTMINNM